jgi:PhzF family phenazine biosynthesis protein
MSFEQLKLKFYRLDVFTTVPYKGNPLAIVHLPPGRDLEPERKLSIAREFNLSETVFLHENDGDRFDQTNIDIYTTTEELPFAGHPTIGAGWHLLNNVRPGMSETTLLTKAGSIPMVLLPTNGAGGQGIARVKLRVPVDFKVHAPYAHPTIKKDQTRLTPDDYVNGLDGLEVVASIVKGMTFLLVQLKSTDALARLGSFAQRIAIPGLGDWSGFIGLYAFTILHKDAGNGELNGTLHVQTRMFDATLEDPATGSAASTLAGWLAQREGKGKWAVEIVQGVEMGRRSEIGVVVTIGDDGEIKAIELVGSAVQVMEGHLWV